MSIERPTTIDLMQTEERPGRDGIVLVDKSAGETSFQVVKRFRRALKIKKVGHAGTLDPFATGLLIMLLGQATKLSPYIMSGVKQYQGTIHLGVETDTLDPEGRVTHVRAVPSFRLEQIQEVVRTFIGEIEQIPPSYSALKYKGKRAYAWARQGVRVELPKRVVRIHSIEIRSIDLPDITMEIRCSGGTYIRRLAADIGNSLGPGAHLKSLRRLSNGPFSVQNAMESGAMGDFMDSRYIWERMISLKDSLVDMKEIQVDDPMTHKIRNGYRPKWEELFAGSTSFKEYDGPIKVVNGSTLITVMEIKRVTGENQDWFKKMRVFH